MVTEFAERGVIHNNGHVNDGHSNGEGRASAAAAAKAGPSGQTPRQSAVNQIANHRVASTQDYLARAGSDIYGEYVFGEDAQRQYLARPIFAKLRRTIAGAEPFDPAIVDAVAHGVKEWAMAKGATHYTHWFIPMTGSTAEKHDSFLSPSGEAKTRVKAYRRPRRRRPVPPAVPDSRRAPVRHARRAGRHWGST